MGEYRPRLLMHCHHSLGTGHLVRSFALAQALRERFRVVILSGGALPPGLAPPAGVELALLPPVGMAADGSLVSHSHRSVADALVLRQSTVLDAFRRLRPDVVLVELFPFGRKKLSGELISLLDEARAAGAFVACSLRDVLVTDRRDQEAHDERASMLANLYLDAVLVHADPRVARLEESFAPQTPLRVPVHYTGFVTGGPPPVPAAREPRVVVSVGGGLVGEPLLRAAIAAQPLLAREGLELRVLAGPFLPERAWESLRVAVRGVPGLELLRAVPDLRAELASASVSVSQCGYNTALDLLATGISAIVVPFAGGRENEQARRAGRLEELGMLRTLDAERLDPETLAAEICAARSFRPRLLDLDLDGAGRSAELLADLSRAGVAA
ncbi:MAG: hypothetical protein HW413_23 [Thermoleophilia bacterium]|nr:hypothetical protein [Thermoleophilia bacterium]